MDQNSAFDKRNLKTINIEQRDYLEELGLPPDIITFIRKKKQQLLIIGVAVVVILLGWSGINYYLESRHEKSTAMLAAALKPTIPEERAPLIEKVLKEYPGTDAGLWANIAVTNEAAMKKDYDKAITGYKAILGKLSSRNLIRPFVIYGLASALEDSGKTDLAEAEYKKMTETPAFATEGYLALARLSELRGDAAKAAEYYTKAQADKDAPASTSEWAKYKMSMLNQKIAPKPGETGANVDANAAEKK